MRRDNNKINFFIHRVIILSSIATVLIICYLLFVEHVSEYIVALADKQMEQQNVFMTNDFENDIKIIIMLLAVVSFGLAFAARFLFQKFVQQNNSYENSRANAIMYKLKAVLLEIDKDGNIISYNPYAEKLFNLKYQEKRADKSFFDIIIEADRKVADSMVKKYSGGVNTVNYTLRGISETGDMLYILWSCCGTDDNGNVTLMGSNQTDIVSYEKRLLMSEERYFRSAQIANDIFYEMDLKSNNLIFGDKFKDVTGYKKIEYDMDEYIKNLVDAEDQAKLWEFVDKFRIGEKKVNDIEHKLIKSNGEAIWVRVAAALLSLDGHDEAYIVGSVTDINESKLSELKIKQLAYYDALTQIPNRLSFQEHVTESLKKNNKAVLFFIDIDNFKFVNDNFGHGKGDDLLVSIAKVLNNVATGKSIVARLGGDEFGMFFEDITTEEAAAAKADELMQLFSSLVKNTPLFSRISPSIGIVVCPNGGTEYYEVINNADIAMYAAKKMGKCCYKIFEQSMKTEMVDLTEMEFHLSKAIENNELYLVYQPIYSNLSKEVVAFEALIRWNSPIYGTVMPNRIVSIAELGTLMYTIGYWVIEQAALYSKRLADYGQGGVEVSVNISMKQFLRDDFVQNVISIINKTEADPSKLVFEIDQKVTFDNYELLERKMIELNKFGIKFALDDVSSHLKKLVNLLRLPISTIKLDVRLSHPDLFESGDASLIEPIVSLAKEHAVTIVVESVEDKDLIDKIFISYADRLQGYALSRPIPEESTYGVLTHSLIKTADKAL